MLSNSDNKSIILEQKLIESMEPYRTIINSIADPLHIVDRDLRILLINSAFECWLDNLGIEKNILGRTVFDVFPFPPKKARIEYEQVFDNQKNLYTEESTFVKGMEIITNTRKIPIFKEGHVKYILTIIRDITERMNIEKIIKESEEKYRLLAENINDIIVVINKDFQIEYINEEVHNKVLNIKEEDVLGKNILNFIHPDDKTIGLNELQKGLKNKEGIIEIRVRDKNGHYIWFEVKGKAFLNNKGEIKGLLIARDITKRKQAEEKLRESEELYRTLVETMTDGLSVLDANSCISYVNISFSNMLGYSSDELLGISVLNYLDKENQKILKNQLQRRREGELTPYELTWIRKDGHKIYTIISPKQLINSEGNFKGSFGVITNITERKIAEQNLKESEEKYRQLFENSPEGIGLTNPEGIVLDFNSAAGKMFGFRKDEVVGRPFYKTGIFDSNQISIIQKINEEIKIGIQKNFEEFQVKRKDGGSLWILYQSTIVRLGNEPCVLAIIQDITDMKKAEKLIEQELIKLKELDDIKNELITRASHELKTPLTYILCSTDLLLTLYQDFYTDEVKELIEIINKGAKRLENLVRNTIDISLMESKSIFFMNEKEDIGKLINECAEDMIYLVNKRELTLDLNTQESIFIKIDKNKIKQVIKNIVLNAIKNTPPKGNISISLNRLRKHLEILIKDTGVGFTETEKQKLFQKFGKIERYGKNLDVDIEGPGLGLYLAKQIVEMHGGKIRAESEGINKGSSFIIELPIK